MFPRSLVRIVALAACALASPWLSPLSAQGANGTLTGKVTDAANGQPIGNVQVMIVGTTLGALSNQEGTYVVRGIAPGTVTVRAIRIGYSESRATATISTAQSTTLNLQLKSVPATLNPVVTTVTGEQRRIEVGNAIAQVNAENIVETRGVANVADLLTSRAAGVMVVPGVQTGAGVRVRIRGTSSIALTNNPIWVIDGIRVDGSTGSSTVSVGGTTPSRVGDLNPEEIESMEVVRGPSASTLYGTDAANGVIVIKTKRGVAGKPQWTYYTEQTGLQDRNQYPTAYRAWRTGATGTTNSTASNTVQCFLSQQASGACRADSTTAFNLHDDPETTPYGTGYRTQHGLQVKGGSENVRYFLHGEYENEDGVTKIPEFEQRYLRRLGLSLLPEQSNPNALKKYTTRANLNLTLSPKADLTISSGFTNQNLRLPSSDDSGTAGIAANTYGGPGMKYNLAANGDTLWGWRQFTPRSVYQRTTNQEINRLINSVGANYRPSTWLFMRGNFGLDFINRVDQQLCRFQNCPDIGQDRQGFKIDNRTNFFTYTADFAATATKKLTDGIESKTTVGGQMFRSVFDRNGASGLVLPPGAVTVTAGATKTADESSSETRTLGGYIEENLGFGDRLFVTGAIRSDRNSAFGADFETVFYPKLAVSYVISQEDFFPKWSWLDQLRLRSAYGASGVQPGTIDAVQYYSAIQGRGESGEVPALVYSTLGNRSLRPERSTELEIGLDGTYFGGRVNSEITWYNKVSKDALVSKVLPPSLGTGATARLENLGEVRNRGVEALITAQLVQRKALGLDVQLNLSHNDNVLQSLGGQPTIGTTQQQRAGYPLYGWWSRQLTGYDDKNGNGIIEYSANAALSEITVTDTSVFIGYSTPRTEAAFTTGIDLFNKSLRLSAMLDYKGGMKIYNNTERIRCASRLNCQAIADKNASLFDQARAVMVREHPSRSVAGYFEDGDFIRFRELSATYQLPTSVVGSFFRGRNLTATASVRNVGILWTKYTGVDPEAFGNTGDAPSEFQAFGPPTYFALRLSFGF